MDTTANTQQQARRHRAWRITRASVLLMWSVLAIFAGLLLEMFQVAVRFFGNDNKRASKENPYDNVSGNNLYGPMYNARTGSYDDGGDPYGIYDSEFDEI